MAIWKITPKYKKTLPDSEKAAHILRIRQLHYTDVLAAEERSCQQTEKRLYTNKELLDCMADTWKLGGGTPVEGKSADALALVNLTNQRIESILSKKVATTTESKGTRVRIFHCSRKRN